MFLERLGQGCGSNCCLRGAHVLGHVPWLGKYVFKIPGAAATVHLMRKYGISRASIRIKSGSTQRDLFHYLVSRPIVGPNRNVTRIMLQNDEDGVESAPPSFQQVVSDGLLAIVAGADSTSGVLTTIFYCLLRNPAIYKRLQEEVDKYYPPESNALDTKYHNEMSYLNAIM